jgi:ATP-dependent DNA ligase
MSLPLPIDYAPMEADTAREIPTGPEWEYEPKWDGFRCLAFRDGGRVHIMSKSGQPLVRYFPEIEEALLSIEAKKFVLDGELIVTQEHTLNFDALLQRIHPAESRIRKLAKETPATLLVFDLL